MNLHNISKTTVALLAATMAWGLFAAGAVAETREQRAERELRAANMIELRVLEWLHFFPDPLTANTSIRKTKTLESSGIWGIPHAYDERDSRGAEKTLRVVVYCHLMEGQDDSCDAALPNARLTRVGDTWWTRVGGAVGLVFDSGWSAPIEVSGLELPYVEFSGGTVSVVNGELRFSDGLEAVIYDHPTSKSHYRYDSGRWTVSGFSAVV